MDVISGRLQPAAKRLLAAWLQLPRLDGVPTRASFDPTVIASVLPVVSVIQRICADVWRVRLAGTEIERRWGRMLTGHNYSDILSVQAATVIYREFEAVCRKPCGSWSLRHLELRSGRQLQIETVRLPLRGKDGEVDLILSCNGEVTPGFIPEADQSREVITVVEQEFFDIGAGRPAGACLSTLLSA